MWKYNETMQKCLNLMMLQMKTQNKHNLNQLQKSDHPNRILIIGVSRSAKKSLFNLISDQPDINKTYLYAEDQYEARS